MALAVAGTVAAMDPADPDRAAAGVVSIGTDGLVEGVAPRASSGALPLAAAQDAWVFPGVVDLHSHIGFNTLPLWAEPSRGTPWAHRDQWPGADSYRASVSWPAWTLARCAPEALLAYVAVKALAGGTTAIQGSPTVNRPRDDWIVRAVDDETFGTGDESLLLTSVVTKSRAELREVRPRLEAGSGLVYHCAEGAPGSLVEREFRHLAEERCLVERLVAIHASAVTDFSPWAGSPGGVVWSPFSNLWLYGATTDVPAAMAAGVTVALGSDWSPSGTKHVLGELKVAALVNEHEGWGLTHRQLAAMVTSNPGDLLARCWPHPAGRLVPGAVGDVTVVSRRSDDPWADLVATREADVLLVVVGGRARYGTPGLMAAAGATAASTALTVAGVRRRVAVPDPGRPGRPWSLARIRRALAEVRANPAAAIERAERERLRAVVERGPAASEPLVVTLDMPFGSALTAGPPEDPEDVVVPPVEGLTHSRAWLASLRGRGFHGGVLDGLASYYTGRR